MSMTSLIIKSIPGQQIAKRSNGSILHQYPSGQSCLSGDLPQFIPNNGDPVEHA